MKKTNGFNFIKYKSAVITIEIQSIMPEKFINLLWKDNIYIKNIRRKNITTRVMEVRLSDFYKINKIAKRNGVRIKIVKRRGLSFLLLRFKKNKIVIVGVMLFIGIVYYMSTFIWKIDINTDSSLPPYEIRQTLKNYGVVPGISKKNLDVYKLESFLIKNNDNIMWVRARIDGSRLIVTVEERKSPPNIVLDNSPCDLIASKDGEVIRLYTTAGTPVVKVGDVVKKGQLLVSGVQGKEGSTYPIHADGKVLCRTFYERSQSVKITDTKTQRTGKKIENYYININGKKLYLKKHINNFSKYDKIEERKLFFNKETFYEVKDVTVKKDANKVVESTGEKLYRDICSNLDKSVKILNKIVDKKQEKNGILKVRVMVIAEENITLQIKHKENIEEDSDKDSIDNKSKSD
jgi:similar to stage IV sporulation protein